MYYLFLDEIQMLDCFEAVLNGYLRKDNKDVFVTGSNTNLLPKILLLSSPVVVTRFIVMERRNLTEFA